ncbi:uncharacterized protein GGS25DRAFT_484411 [Hypoxylon fragiforme]|uniref:uncharacterized protein n=1 Tax=Hypoxylon fragiforme TaxID=63214 RepID=UPI0020C60B32|nr:uncharacterized protein GGS25DRAFT_484411 [Hypoxylon fragiforme]KAI2609365.1 hypothetical protein GGS25DRAFT_484411 [Hypoxylon fragiforme]
MAPVNENPEYSLGKWSDGPASPPPDDIISNFSNPPNKNALVRAVLILVLIITSICVLVRVYSGLLLKKLTVPDVLGILAFALYVTFVNLFFELVNSYGWFIHMWDLQLKDFPAVNQVYFEGLLIYFGLLILIKSAILLEWISIFVPAGTHNFFFWISWSIMAIHALFYISMIILELTACSPFEKTWNPLVSGKCLDTMSIAVIMSTVNLIFDVLIFLLPQKVIWGLQMRSKKKIGLSILFAVGILACVAAAFRLAASLEFYNSRDTSYTFSGLALWCLAEVTCGFIVLCGPSALNTIRHLQIQQLATRMRFWAGSPVRKFTSPGGSSRNSISSITRKQSNSSLSQKSLDHEEYDTIAMVPWIPVSHDSNPPYTQPEYALKTDELAMF